MLFSSLKRVFVPRYSELALFVMGYTCLLFFAVNVNQLKDVSFNTHDKNTGVLIVFLILLAGLALSIFNAFVKRRKSSLEKLLMLIFAVLLNGFSGLWAGTYLLGHTKGILLFLPLWNIFSGWILISTLKESTGFDESRISDKDARLIEVAIGAFVATIVFIASKYGFHHNWAITFSLCVVYATNINEPIVSAITGKHQKIADC